MRAARLVLIAVVVSQVGPAAATRLRAAQGPAECASLDCPGRDARPVVPATLDSVWREVAELHQAKLQFVAALQRVTRAQPGTVGDEGAELAAGVNAMRAALTKWDAQLAQFERSTSRLTPQAELHVARAAAFLDRLRPGDASRELAAADRLDGDRTDVPALQALALDAAGKPDEALRAMRRAVARDPGGVLSWYWLAQRALELKDSAEARRAWCA